jgi:hypothetical protein
MRLDSLSKHFEGIGARVKFGKVELRGRIPRGELPIWRAQSVQNAIRRLPSFTIDVAEDRGGEYFDIRLGSSPPRFEVLQSVPGDRHLLMLTSDGRRFLFGHDERHWFVSEIRRPVSTVRDAKISLMPETMREQARGMKTGTIGSRRSGSFKRQGEWFFVPSEREFDESIVHRNEPIQRTARSKPHICEELVRVGGEIVYALYGNVYKKAEYEKLKPEERRRARAMVRNPLVFARGPVRHPDHATIRLDRWHLVMLNGEVVSTGANRNVVWLD